MVYLFFIHNYPIISNRQKICSWKSFDQLFYVSWTVAEILAELFNPPQGIFL